MPKKFGRAMFALAAAALCLPPLPAVAQMSPPSGATGACTIVGPLLGPSDFGVPAGQPVADATAALLPDGRVRLYMYICTHMYICTRRTVASSAPFR